MTKNTLWKSSHSNFDQKYIEQIGLILVEMKKSFMLGDTGLTGIIFHFQALLAFPFLEIEFQ